MTHNSFEDKKFTGLLLSRQPYKKYHEKKLIVFDIVEHLSIIVFSASKYIKIILYSKIGHLKRRYL